MKHLSGLNAVDRPDLSFRSNGTLIVTNLVLNVVLVSAFGWVGAAVATACSAGIALLVTYRYIRGVVNFSIPLTEIGKQIAAAAVMALIVFVGRLQLFPYFVDYEFAVAIGLVFLGAAVYFVVLFGLSVRFREAIRRNIEVISY